MTDTFEDLGPNSGLVDEMYRQYVADPGSVAPSWQEFFSDYVPSGSAAAPAPAPAPAPAAAPAAPAPAPVRPASTNGDGAAPLVLDGEEPRPIRGAAARIVENMEASLGVPTATSVRNVPAKLLEVNRQILNNHLSRTGRGKVSFTHLIAYAAVQAIRQVPAMSSGYGVENGAPVVVRHEHVNLGLAVDVAKSDGSRTLLVPNIKGADTVDFAGFFAAYEDLIRKVRVGGITPDDFAGTTATITNPGTIGTVHSVPRLMPGQGFILGVGAIGYPAEYEGADPQTVARLGISKVITLTSTYDHRVIQGAESGEFLRSIHDLLLGADEFYDDIFGSFGVPYEPARWTTDISPLDDETTHNEKVVHVHQLINMYRVRGHLIANLDPLGRREPDTHPELDINHHGLSIWDLDREFPVGSLGAGHLGTTMMPLRDILGVVRDAYARTVGVEFMHIQDPEQKEWIQTRVEAPTEGASPEVQRRILDRLNAAEAFEAFLGKKYLGQKRFSLEGAESLIPMLDALLSAAADGGMSEAVLGTAHRGRLNVLVNTVGKSYNQIFREFEGALDPSSVQGSGDVKYHVGATGTHRAPSGATIGLTLASNPSHLEAVDPVVEGMARATGDRLDDQGRGQVLPILVHGDAAFAGQGVVAETLNLSEVPGYEVGGTVHIVVNNQLGFTTAPELGRSGVYATDVAKMVQAPIFHVNGDDPEACVRVVRLAYEFRQAFRKDVVVDMVCYRKYGHNEGDEPAFTQPRMYELIRAHRSVRKLYTETLVNRGDLTLAQAEETLDDFSAQLDNAFEETHQSGPPTIPVNIVVPEEVETAVVTGVPRDRLRRVVDALVTSPDDFQMNPKLRAHPGDAFHRVRCRPRRLGAGRGARLRVPRDGGHAGPARRPGHPARDVQPAARRARRPRHRGGVLPTRARRPRAGAGDALRHGALRVRRARLRVRLLGVGPGCVGRLGGAVRRLHQRRADHRRPVRRRRRGQVGSAVTSRAAPPPRLRGAGTRALQRPTRALPRALRREQPQGLLPDHRGAVLPRAAPPDPRAVAQAARLLHSEEVPAGARHPVHGRRARARQLLRDPRRPSSRGRRRARSGGRSCAPARSPTSSWTDATSSVRRSWSSGSSSCIRGPSPSSSSSRRSTRTADRCGGCRRSRRTWAPGTTCTGSCIAS